MSTIKKISAHLRVSEYGRIVACLGGLALVFLVIGREAPRKAASPSTTSSAPKISQRPVRAMNLALGDMVFLAQELGFRVASSRAISQDGDRTAARVESQLRPLRELYRQESGKDPALVGSILLRFNVSAAGEVSEVNALASRLKDGDFKKAVIAEVAKWSFAGVIAENATVTCPLLFVREGMDIATLVQWEKSLANLVDKTAPMRTAEIAAPRAGAHPERSAAANGTGKDARLMYATWLRNEPTFSARSITQLGAGSRVIVLDKSGDWLKVRAGPEGSTGFVRREFVRPLEMARR